MAERIVSPGVFTNEVDQSFLPAAISNIGAALIGVCEKGPAFIPTVVDGYTDFKIKFGGLNSDYYLPYSAKSYLKSAGTATIVRVLGSNGYTATSAIILKSSGTGGVYGTGSITFTDPIAELDHFYLTGSDDVAVRYVAINTAAITSGDVSNSSTIRYFESGSAAVTAITLAASASKAINDGPSNISSTYTSVISAGTSRVEITGSTAGTAVHSQTIDAQGGAGFTAQGTPAGTIAGGVDATGAGVYAALFPTASGESLSGVNVGSDNNVNEFVIQWAGSAGDNASPTMSLHSTDSNYIANVLGNGPSVTQKSSGNGYPVYVYNIFKNASDNATGTDTIIVDVSSTDQVFGVYQGGSTPYITSQTDDGTSTGTPTNLFKFSTLSDGEYSNTEIKLAISNIKKPGSIAGSDYGSFDVTVRKFDDSDKRPQSIETYAGCNLDPDSVNYVARRIGDQVRSFDSTTKKISILGDYENKSKYIKISDISDDIKNGRSSDLYPFGFDSYNYPFKTAGADLSVDIPMRLNQSSSDAPYAWNSKIYHGLAFDSGSTSISGYSKDILPYLSPVPADAAITSSAFQLEGCGVDINATLSTKKFVLGFQGGNDGFDPRSFGGPDSDGKYWGLGKAQTSDSASFTNAIATIANPDEVDVNMLIVPGADSKIHTEIVSNARDTVEDRADCFYVYDSGDWQSTNADVISAVATIDSNYSSTYWPWVKIFDDENNKHVWVPPSVVVPGVIAYTDKVSHPWFAPAGLNRGGLTEVIMAKERLTHSDRDDLYEGRINPIATFPGEGVVIWGQKTLQAKPSALDRVNVRRLLIKLKKFIASSSRYLVFEQNTEATRQRFLNIVNPFLESVQSNSGLTAFRVVVDETNNTPDVIDRNELKGQIFIQPTRTSEFIVLDFVVMPTGASFPE